MDNNNDDDFLESFLSTEPRKLIAPNSWGEKNKFDGKEDTLQTQCWGDLKHKEGELLGFHVANERKTKTKVGKNGKRFSFEGNLLKAKGVVAGLPDIIIAEARGGYFGIVIELKTKGDNLSEHQKYILDQFARKGWHTNLCWNREAFNQCLDTYLTFKPTEK